MAWANTTPIPDSSQLSINYSYDLGSILPLEKKFVPKNFDGTKFDCTAATGVSRVAIDNGSADPIYVHSAVTGSTLVTHDATGFTVTLDPTAILTAIGVVGASSGRYKIDLTDGTTVLTLAQGRYTLQQNG